MKHTPGPWTFDEEQQGCKEIVGGDGEEVASTPGRFKEDEDLANARLIAAAPKLLAAISNVMTDDQLDTKPAALEGLTVRQLLRHIKGGK